MGVLEVLLHLLALVEDGAVAVRAEDVLVEGALAALAAGPELVEDRLVLRHLVVCFGGGGAGRWISGRMGLNWVR